MARVALIGLKEFCAKMGWVGTNRIALGGGKEFQGFKMVA